MQQRGWVAVCSPCLACMPGTWAEALSLCSPSFPWHLFTTTILVACLGVRVPCPSQPLIDLCSVQGVQKKTPVPPPHGVGFCVYLFPRNSGLILTHRDWDTSFPSFCGVRFLLYMRDGSVELPGTPASAAFSL